jgi:hypothetical protein
MGTSRRGVTAALPLAVFFGLPPQSLHECSDLSGAHDWVPAPHNEVAFVPSGPDRPSGWLLRRFRRRFGGFLDVIIV